MVAYNKSEFPTSLQSTIDSPVPEEEENIMQLVNLNNTLQFSTPMNTALLGSFNIMDEFYNQRIFNRSHYETDHFSLLSVKSCSLISKSKLKHKLAQKNPSQWNNNITNTNIKTDKAIGLNKYIFGSPRPKPTLALNQACNDLNDNRNTKTLNEIRKNNNKPQKKKKKLPYLDKKIRRGYLKFFDAKNNFGFMKLLDPPKSDIFVFGREFIKSEFSQELLLHANGNTNVVFNFRTIHYEGKHGESKKAVEMTLEGIY